MHEQATERLYRILGQRFREARSAGDRAKKISQEAVAKRLGVKRSSVVNFEKGRQRFPIHMIYAYAEVVGMEIHEVLPSLREILDAEKTPAATVRIGDHEHEVPGEAAADFIRNVLSEQTS